MREGGREKYAIVETSMCGIISKRLSQNNALCKKTYAHTMNTI